MDQDIMQAGLRNMTKDPILAELWVKLMDAENSDEIREQMYNHILRYHHSTATTIYELDNRIEQLELKRFGKKASATFRSQQMLILYYLGVFDNESMKKISSNKKRAKLLATLLNSSSDNIEGDLSIINLNQSAIKSITNLEFVCNVFEEAGLKEIVKEIESEILKLDKVSSKK